LLEEISKFDVKSSSNTISFSKKNTIATFNGSGWKGTGQAKKSLKYCFQFLKIGNTMFGYAPNNINKGGNNYTSCGYYIYSVNGLKYGQGVSAQSFGGSACNQINTPYGIKYDPKKGEITFYNGKNKMGIAYSGLKKLKLFPTIDFCTVGTQVQFIKVKFKK